MRQLYFIEPVSKAQAVAQQLFVAVEKADKTRIYAQQICAERTRATTYS